MKVLLAAVVVCLVFAGGAEAKPLTQGQAERATVRYLEREVGGTASVNWCHRKPWGFRCLGTVRDFSDFFVRSEPGDYAEVPVGVKPRHHWLHAWNPAFDD